MASDSIPEPYSTWSESCPLEPGHYWTYNTRAKRWPLAVVELRSVHSHEQHMRIDDGEPEPEPEDIRVMMSGWHCRRGDGVEKGYFKHLLWGPRLIDPADATDELARERATSAALRSQLAEANKAAHDRNNESQAALCQAELAQALAEDEHREACEAAARRVRELNERIRAAERDAEAATLERDQAEEALTEVLRVFGWSGEWSSRVTIADAKRIAEELAAARDVTDV